MLPLSSPIEYSCFWSYFDFGSERRASEEGSRRTPAKKKPPGRNGRWKEECIKPPTTIPKWTSWFLGRVWGFGGRFSNILFVSTLVPEPGRRSPKNHGRQGTSDKELRVAMTGSVDRRPPERYLWREEEKIHILVNYPSRGSSGEDKIFVAALKSNLKRRR